MAILREFFLLLEYRDRVAATAETYQKKLIRRYQDAKEKKELRGGPTSAVNKALDKEQNLDAAKTMVEYFAKNDPTKNNKYLDWVVRQWLKEKLLWEDAFKMINLLNDFEKYRKKLDKKDLNQYASYRDVEEALEPHRGKEVAGVRVQNFLKKDDVQNFRKSQVADPSASKHQEQYNLIHADDYDEDDMPQWFEDDLHSSATAHAEEVISWEDYDGYDELDKRDYEDEDGELDEMRYDEDAREQAGLQYEAAKEEFVESYIRGHGEEEWREYVQQQRADAENSLEGSHHKVAELDVIYENDRMAVMIPNSKDAACFIGKGTEWCTAAEVSENAWWEYAQDDPLYAVVTDKIGKYQFHFESNQYMDVHDRYIEDSDALKNLVSQYSKELNEAFGDLATYWYQHWMLPAEKTPYANWDKLLQASESSHSGHAREAVRQYQAHAKNAPEGWADTVRKNLLSGEVASEAIKYGWVGKLTSAEIEKVIATPKLLSSSVAQEMAQHIHDGDIGVNREAWETLIQRQTDTLFYAPTEILDRELLDNALQKEEADDARSNVLRTSAARRRSFLSDFYTMFKHIKDDESKHVSQADMDNLDDWVSHVEPSKKDYKTGLENGRKVAGMVTMNDIIRDVLNKPEVLQHYKMDFGMKPWMALANKSMDDEKSAETFINIAAMVMRTGRNEPWAKDIATLFHQVIKQHPDLVTTFNNGKFPSEDMPLDTQNAVLDHVAQQTGAGNQGASGYETDAVAKATKAKRVQQAMDDPISASPANIDPNAREALFRYRQGGEDADEIRARVPAQHQLDM